MSERWDRISPECRESAADGGTVAVRESANEGRAELRFEAPPGWRLEALTLHHRYRFDWLAERKAADGIVLARTPEGRWQAHIVECKRTIGTGTWAQAQQQLGGSRIRLDALAGVLGVQIDQVCLYTAFRREKLGVQSTDPVLGAIAIDRVTPSSPGAQRAAWRAATIAVAGGERLRHRHVQLVVVDDVGRAQIVVPGE